MREINLVCIKSLEKVDDEKASADKLLDLPLTERSMIDRKSIVVPILDAYGIPHLILTSFDRHVYQTAEPFIEYCRPYIHNGETVVRSICSLSRCDFESGSVNEENIDRQGWKDWFDAAILEAAENSLPDLQTAKINTLCVLAFVDELHFCGILDVVDVPEQMKERQIQNGMFMVQIPVLMECEGLYDCEGSPFRSNGKGKDHLC